MTRTELPLPETFQWKQWSPRRIHHWKPGDPDPSAVIYELRYGAELVASILDLNNGQWLVTVGAGFHIERRRHQVAESEAQARYWCEKWCQREAEYLRQRFPLVEMPYGKPIRR